MREIREPEYRIMYDPVLRTRPNDGMERHDDRIPEIT